MVAIDEAIRKSTIWLGNPNMEPMCVSIPQRVSFAARLKSLKSTRSTTSRVWPLMETASTSVG